MKIFIASLFCLSSAVAAPKSDSISYTFKNIELTDLIAQTSTKLGKKFVVDPMVHGKVSILLPGPVSKEEAYNAFMQALAINSTTTFEQGGYTRVVPAFTATRGNLEVLDHFPDPDQEKMVTVVVRLQHTSAKNVYGVLGPTLVSKNGEVRADENSNSLVFTDFVSSLTRVKKIIEAIDTPQSKLEGTAKK